MRYFRDDDFDLVTLDEVKSTYLELKADGDLQNYESFDSYLSACQSYNNGSLTEISVEEAKRICVSTVDGRSYSDYMFRLKELTSNGKEVNWVGVNAIILDEEENRIVEARGHSHERKFFCDKY